jgi:hypothetical protein
MTPSINDINFSNQLLLIDRLLVENKVNVEIGFWGSRTVTIEGYDDSISLNDFLRKIIYAGCYQNVDQLSSAKRLAGQHIVGAVGNSKRSLDQRVWQQLKLWNSFTRTLAQMREDSGARWQLSEYTAENFQSYNEPMFRLAFGLAPEDSVEKHPAYSRRDGSRIFARYVAQDDLQNQKIKQKDEEIQKLEIECSSIERDVQGLRKILETSTQKTDQLIKNSVISALDKREFSVDIKTLEELQSLLEDGLTATAANTNNIEVAQSLAKNVGSITLDMLHSLGIPASSVVVHQTKEWVELKMKESDLPHVRIMLLDGRSVETDLSKLELDTLKAAINSFVSGIMDTSSWEGAEKILSKCFAEKNNTQQAS